MTHAGNLSRFEFMASARNSGILKEGESTLKVSLITNQELLFLNYFTSITPMSSPMNMIHQFAPP